MRSGCWAARWKEKGVVLLKEARVFGWRWKLLRLNEKKRHCADLHLSYETPFIHYYPHLITTSLTQLPSPFSSITLSEKSARRRRHWSIRAGKKMEWTVILLWTMPLSFFSRKNTLYRLCLQARVIFPLDKKSNGDQDHKKCPSDFHLYGPKWDTKAHLTGFIVGVWSVVRVGREVKLLKAAVAREHCSAVRRQEGRLRKRWWALCFRCRKESTW